MDSTDEEFYGSTSFTTKGRRTKRQRTTTTSSYGGGNGGGAYLDNSYGSSASATPSPSTPDDHDIVSEVTTEEQDMANCLILLAQGLQKRRSSKANNNSHNNNNTSTSVVIGVYECKTCNRTFPSFQALGGHRTSHKKIIKPPSTTAPNTTQPPKSVHQHRDNATEGGSQDSSPVPLPRENTRKSVANRNSDKVTTRVHECSICGSEFPSGQALGGHMRRHRPAVTPHDRPMIGDVSTSTAVIDLGGASRNILSLDLNLPAPNDDHDQVIVDDSSHMVETKFHVLPTPALLDCHY